jgi:hypothetical protein
MKLAKVFAALFLLMSSSADAGRRGADNYNFGKKEFERTEITIKIVLLHDRDELIAAAEKFGLDAVSLISASSPFALKSSVEAFSLIDKDENKCTIYMKDPGWRYEPESYGHDLAHCIWGRWHKPK